MALGDGSSDDLLQRLSSQAEANRAAALEETDPKELERKALYLNEDGRTQDGVQYRIAGGVSSPQGTALAANYDPESGEVVFVETYTDEDGLGNADLDAQRPCVSGTDCLDDNFCYGWYECDPCEWCEGNQCVERDPARPCLEDWECPCAPNDQQHYICNDEPRPEVEGPGGRCRLTCATNDDCGECEVCHLTEKICVDGCQNDSQCIPGEDGSAGDAQPNTFCIDCECTFPCDPVRCCNADSDCFDYEYCGDREYRADSDPEGCISQCFEGCRDDSSCEEGQTCNLETRACEYRCGNDEDCPEGEKCNDDGLCSSVGEVCLSDSDCDGVCVDGYCVSGCFTDTDCEVSCEKYRPCVDACPPQIGCSCFGEGCYNENWQDLCPRDEACVDACPIDPVCAKKIGNVCVAATPRTTTGRCERPCSDSSDCEGDEICSSDYLAPGAQLARALGEPEGDEADQTLTCRVIQSNAFQPADPRLGCDCGETCNQYGTCEPVVCSADEQCPPCSICEEGRCIEGCSSENPCPGNNCCKPDGRCGQSCKSDANCPGAEVCLAGGCCGLVCDPLLPCVSSSDCEPGFMCSEEGYCMEGCGTDSDCADIPGQFRCEKRYVKRPNGALAPCEKFPNEECFSEFGQCVQFCNSDPDCSNTGAACDPTSEVETCFGGARCVPTCPEGESECQDGVCLNGDVCVVDEEGNGSCEQPTSACTSDADCTFDGTKCLGGECKRGCRFDDECGTGESCVENTCKMRCTSTAECVALVGVGNTCVEGYCEQVNGETPGTVGANRAGCECYEFCGEGGVCTPFECDSDLDCDEEACGSCLVGNVCGECFSDAQCPGTKVCDLKTDEAGNYIIETDPLTGKPIGGRCAFACTPISDRANGVCFTTEDCPSGFFCSDNKCQRGCEENDDCLPDEVCRSGQCRKKCPDENCPPGYTCVQGACLYQGNPCDPQNNEVMALEAEIEKLSRRRDDLDSQKDQLDANLQLLEQQQAAIAGNISTLQGRLQSQLDAINAQQDELVIEYNNCPAGPEGDACRQPILDEIAALTEQEEQITAEIGAQIDGYAAQLTSVESAIASTESQILAKQQEIEAVEDQSYPLEVERDIAVNKDCPSGEVCQGDQCYPAPIECLESFECDYPATCVDGQCKDPPNAEDFESFEPEVIGCESCADMCEAGKCVPATCIQDDDCPCGFCGKDGKCREACRTDFDCGSAQAAGVGVGRCVAGECQACTSSLDCASVGPGAICDAGECKTPCEDSLSTGSCESGLEDGDTCQNCPTACPDDSPCQKTEEVCNVRELYDPIAGQMRVQVEFCKKCSKTCVSSSDCEDGTICGAFGICEPDDGRCTDDSDCYETALSKGLSQMRCQLGVCIEPGTTCFTRSDCDAGEVCVDGACVPGDCSDQDPCDVGKACVQNYCRWDCGGEIYFCGENSPSCPPGYKCDGDRGYGGVCIRPGMTVSEAREGVKRCPVGELCCDGGCVPRRQGSFECCGAEDCPGDQQCCEGICRRECGQRDPGNTPADVGVNQQNACERIGQCCGPDGWCEPCGCDENNPCTGAGECCDKESGVCVQRDAHPNTKYGAPEACYFDGVFCQVKKPNDQDGEPDQEIVAEDLGEADYPGCEVVDFERNIVRCWQGGDKTDEQVRLLLRDACFKPEKKECKCEDFPAVDECATDADCGECGKCETKRYRNDACCGIYGEGEIETVLGLENSIPETIDFVERNTCVQKSENCGCRVDTDCTECEYCEGATANQLGVCREDCENRCPCGGPLTNNRYRCKTCEEAYGPCAVEGTYEVEDVVDEETGEVTQKINRASCSCGVDYTKNCCQGLSSVEEMRRQKTLCLRKSIILATGEKLHLQTEKCIDAQADECAQCEEDEDCPGEAVCKGYKCIRECGGDFSEAGNKAVGDFQDVDSIGGDPYTCYCCDSAGSCRPLYDSWIDSADIGSGPFNITYTFPGTGTNYTFRSEQEDFASAKAELNEATKNSSIKAEIINVDAENPRGECRPCRCTATGIDCGPWADCEGCYRWEPEEPNENAPADRATKLRKEFELNTAGQAVEDYRVGDYAEAEEAYIEANLEKASIESTIYILIGEQASELKIIEQQIAEYEKLEPSYRRDIYDAEQTLLQAQQDLESAQATSLPATIDFALLALENAEEQVEIKEQALTDLLIQKGQLQQQRSYLLQEAEAAETVDPEELAELPETDLVLLKQQLEVADQNVEFALAAYDEARDTLYDLEQKHLAALEDYNAILYPQKQFRQVRNGACCIDDLVRPDEECDFGIAYVCAERPDNLSDYNLYEAVLVNAVTRREIRPESEKTAYDSPFLLNSLDEDDGPVWKYKIGEANCVKVNANEFYYWEDNYGSIRNTRYYEYCTGSIIGCVLSAYQAPPDALSLQQDPNEAEYLQGWKYEVYLDEAGIRYTSDPYVSEEDGGPNWIYVGEYEGGNGAPRQRDPRHMSCLYGNPWAFLGANTLGTFYDLVATHSICHKADLTHGCPFWRWDCSYIQRTYFETGGDDNKIRRLKREIKEYEAYAEALEEAEGQVAELKAFFEQEAAAKQEELDELEEIHEGLLETRANAKSSKADKESTLEGLRNNIDEAQEAADEANQNYQEALDIQFDLEAELQQLQAQLSELEAQLAVTETNLASAKTSANAKFQELNDLNAQIEAANDELATMTPGSAEYIQQLNLIANLEIQRDEVAGEYADLSGAINDLTEQALELKDPITETGLIPDKENEIEEKEAEVQTARENVSSAQYTATLRNTDLRDAKEALGARNQEILYLTQEIIGLDEQIEYIESLAGSLDCEDECCPDGRTRVVVNGQVQCCRNTGGNAVTTDNCIDPEPCGNCKVSCAQLCGELENLLKTVDNIDTTLAEIETELEGVAENIEKKQAEIDRLEEISGVPAEVTGPMPLPSVGSDGNAVLSTEEARELFNANVDVDKYLAEQEPWPPGNASQV